MMPASTGRCAAATVALGAALALSACQRGADPIVPAGQAGYDAIAMSSGAMQTQRYTFQPGDIQSVRVYDEPQLSVEEVAVEGKVELPGVYPFAEGQTRSPT